MGRPSDYKPGELIPGSVYRVVRFIGAGGMGTVYDVEDTTIGKRYVLKTLHPDLHKRADLAKRLKKEARELVRLHHPNIVEVFTAGETTDALRLPYYVMERLNGQSLRTILSKKGSLEIPYALHIAIDLLDALQNAHDKGVIHRDVKPDNIFLAVGVNGTTITKLLDFGIMRVLDEAPGPTAGRFMGTLRYAAPEQLRGESPQPQTDIYAAALVLYEMLAGRGPFDDLGDPNKVAGAHLTQTPPPLIRWGAVVPQPLEKLVMGALAKDPAKRPSEADVLGSQLRNIAKAYAAEAALKPPSGVPTAVPLIPFDEVDSGAIDPSSADGRSTPSHDLSPGVSTPPRDRSPGAFAATEQAMTRASTPDAKSPARAGEGGTANDATAERQTLRQDAAALQALARTSADASQSGSTVPVHGRVNPGADETVPSPSSSSGPAVLPLRREAAAHVVAGASPEAFVAGDARTEAAGPAVDRSAATHTAAPAGVRVPDVRDPATGATEPLSSGGSAASGGGHLVPVTLRMNPPQDPPEADVASQLLERLPGHERPPAISDGAASRTLDPAVHTKPLVAVAVGLAATAIMLGAAALAVRAVQSRAATPSPAAAAIAAPEPSPPAAAPPPPAASAQSPAAAPAAPGTAGTPGTPGTPGSKDTPEAPPPPAGRAAGSAASASPEAPAPTPPAAETASGAPATERPAPVRPRAAPGAPGSASVPPAPAPPAPRRKLPGSGL